MADPSGDDDWIGEMLAQGLFDEDPLEAPSPPATDAHWPADAADGTAVNADRSDTSPLAVVIDDAHADDDVLLGSHSSSEPNDEPDLFDQDERSNAAKAIAEWVVVLVGAIAVALVLRAFLFQAFWIPSESMEMTLLERDRVLVNKVSYRLHDVNRGDVIVFRRPDDEPGEIRDLIKRVIGVPGETVQGRNNSIYVNGERLDESYLADDEVILDFGPITVEEDRLFVMGDNRDESLDSRFFGTIDQERIVGRAFVIFWPVSRVGWL